MSAGALIAIGHGALLQAVGGLPGTAGLPVLGVLAGTAEPSPSPTSSTIEIPAEDQTSPGFIGFVVTFGVAVALILLGFSLVRHLRVVEHNQRRRDAAEREDAGREAAQRQTEQRGSTGPGSTGDGAPGARPAPIAIGDPAAEDAAAASGTPAAAEPGTGVEAVELDEDASGPDDPARPEDRR
ncbi:MAG TPA: hypothetical protein VGC67_08345 [Cellulomonas sp.]